MSSRDRRGRAWLLGLLLLTGGSTVLVGCGGKDKDKPKTAEQPK